MDKERKITTIALDSLGCKLNQAETELLARQLADAGYRLVSPQNGADIYVLNTCTVTHVADRKARHLLRLARSRNPDARLIATGCYAERAPLEIKDIEGVDLVLGNDLKSGLLRLLEDSGGLANTGARDYETPYHHNGRTRSFIKVQDGCRNFCAYCIVPLVRNRPESVPVDGIIAQVRSRVSTGCEEVVLTGTEIGTYGAGGDDLKSMLERILSETAVRRIRLSSLQPQEISFELIGLWRDKRLCPHFHLSLQSGSDSVLSRMRRRYTTADFRQAVKAIRWEIPEAAITTDIIVGFPGETGAEFQESLNFCRQMQFARIHVFPFSPRPGTEAAIMPLPVPVGVRKQRSREALALAAESLGDFNLRFSGKTMGVLWEQKTGGVWSGYTGNYIRAYTKSRKDLTNRLLPVRLMRAFKDGMWGELL